MVMPVVMSMSVKMDKMGMMAYRPILAPMATGGLAIQILELRQQVRMALMAPMAPVVPFLLQVTAQ